MTGPTFKLVFDAPVKAKRPRKNRNCSGLEKDHIIVRAFKVYYLFRECGYVTTRDLMKHTGVNMVTAQQYLTALLKAGFTRKLAGRRRGRDLEKYVLVRKPIDDL